MYQMNNYKKKILKKMVSKLLHLMNRCKLKSKLKSKLNSKKIKKQLNAIIAKQKNLKKIIYYYVVDVNPAFTVLYSAKNKTGLNIN